MSGIQAILRKLAQLTPADRQWVLGQLPGEHKRKLLHLQGSSAVEARRAVDVANAFAVIDGASAEAMHSLLAAEPVWFSGALIGCADWSWRDGYFQLLSSLERRDLQGSLLPGKTMTAAMKHALMESVASRLQTAVTNLPAQERGFESLLQKLAAKRSRRRRSGAA